MAWATAGELRPWSAAEPIPSAIHYARDAIENPTSIELPTATQERHDAGEQALGRVDNNAKTAGQIGFFCVSIGFLFLPWTLPHKNTSHSPLLSQRGHSQPVRAVCIDGDRVFSGSEDGTVREWSLISGHNTATVVAHSDWVTALAIAVVLAWVGEACGPKGPYRLHMVPCHQRETRGSHRAGRRGQHLLGWSRLHGEAMDLARSLHPDTRGPHPVPLVHLCSGGRQLVWGVGGRGCLRMGYQ
jgi:hypothetical protein